MPLEGGLYQWSKLAFNDFVAFMVGWNLWVFAITILAGVGSGSDHKHLLRNWTIGRVDERQLEDDHAD